MALVLGVDIGGTFTDLVLVDEGAGRVFIGKELTTPRDPAAAVLAGLARLVGEAGRGADEIARVIHATTLITNAIIERKGARVGLITTRGFRDVLEIGREAKYDIYDMFLPLPPPLVPRERRFEATERLDVDGTVLTPLRTNDVAAAGQALVKDGVDAIAICFLYSYVNAEHERASADLLKQRWPALLISCSSDVAPEIREFERTSTTVANAYVQPLASRYLARLAAGLADAGTRGNLYLMLSSGGITSSEAARATPIQLLESGPAAGALIGAFFGRLTGEAHLLALDMGGTTAKLCLVDDGQPAITYSFEAARERRFKRGSGLPIRIASVELLEVGAGGGSIARIDELGLVKVGPDSAGAEPGPACYARGGTEPTVTDAALVLGYLDANFFLGGAMPLDPGAARRAIDAIAARLGVPIERAAWGIHDIVCEQMASAARIHVAEKGKDPRRYALLATGGAAPGHACRVAMKLGLTRVICPPGAGVASTFGLLVAPPKVDRVASYVTRLDELEFKRLAELYEGLAAEAMAELAAVGVGYGDVDFKIRADMRYVGQGFEIVVPLGEGAIEDCVDGLSPQWLRSAFDAAYLDAYARLIPGAPVEALSWRLTALGPAPRPAFLRDSGASGDASAALKGERPAWFPEFEESRRVPVYDRYRLASAVTVTGPAIVEERESTVVIVPGATCRVDPHGSLVIELTGGSV